MMQLKATIDRFEEGKAVLILDDGQKIIIDKNELAKGVKEGDILYLTLSRSQEATLEKEKLAKNILKEILKQDANETQT